MGPITQFVALQLLHAPASMLCNTTAAHTVMLRLQTHRLRWCAEPGVGGQAQRASEEEGVQAGQLALAWVHHQGDDVFPIPGTKTLRFLQENIAAFDIKLSKQEMTELEEAVPHAAVSL